MVRIKVRVTPSGGRDAIEGWRGDVLLVRVKAAAEDGKANEAVVRLLGRALRAPVRLLAGGTRRTKVVEVQGIDEAVFFERLRAVHTG